MSWITSWITGLGLIGLLGCASIQSIEPVSVKPVRSSTDEWIAGYRAKYGCIGFARLNNGPENIYDSSDQIEIEAKVAYKRDCFPADKILYFKELEVVRRVSPSGEVVGIAFKKTKK